MIHFCARDGTCPKRPDSDRSGRTPDSLGMALTSASGTKLTYRTAYPFVGFRGKADIVGRAASTSSVANDPFQTSAARDCCDAQGGISYSGVVGCNSRGERSTCGRRRASTLGFTRPSQPSWENVGCADDPTSLRAMRCSASRPMGQSRRTNTPDEFAGWARFTSAATPLPRRRQARRTRAVLSIAMSASDASAAG
jgi:hypothetical protein